MNSWKTLAGIGLAILLLIAVYCFASSRQYGEVSDEGYAYATALYSCCNQRDIDKLEVIAQMIEEARSREELGDRETRWLAGIVEQGREGDWARASTSVRQLMEDQVSEG